MKSTKISLSPTQPSSKFKPTLLHLKNLFIFANFLSIFPNKFTESSPHVPPSRGILTLPNGNWCRFRSTACSIGFLILELCQLVPFMIYIGKPETQSEIVLQSLCWEYLSATSYAAFFMWNVFSKPEDIINLLNHWSDVEQEILGR